MAVTGTKEWSSSSVNCVTACAHGCLYCYAHAMAARFDRVPEGGWGCEVVRQAAVDKRYGKRKGVVMYPTTHDLTPENYKHTGKVLRKLLEAGNQVLVVSKPHSAVIMQIVGELGAYRDQVLFRFTIGSSSDRVLSFWEPGAPDFAQRLGALQYAHARGWQTSVSMEPMLGPTADAMFELFHTLAPYVTESIWLGPLNRGEQRLRRNGHWNEETAASLRMLQGILSKAAVEWLVEKLDGHPLVRWKDSIRSMVGMESATKADENWTRSTP